MLEALLLQNIRWASKIHAEEPNYFRRLSNQQTPSYFWIGCADSRVPANVVAGLDPGEVFVHRNVANVIHSSDMNFLSALEYAVDVLHIREIILCGHYGCGGVHAAMEKDRPHGLADFWLEPIRRVANRHSSELAPILTTEQRLERLAELNVVDGVRRVAETPIIRRAWRRQEAVSIHGLIYGLKDGLLRNLDCTMGLEDDETNAAL